MSTCGGGKDSKATNAQHIGKKRCKPFHEAAAGNPHLDVAAVEHILQRGSGVGAASGDRHRMEESK